MVSPIEPYKRGLQLKMGTCYGRCFKRRDSLSRSAHHRLSLSNTMDDITVANEILIDCRMKNSSSFVSRYFKKNKIRGEKKRLDLMEDFWGAPNETSYTRFNNGQSNSSTASGTDIQLQCLDVGNLLTSKGPCTHLLGRDNGLTNLSTPASSLDLEWEHEYNSNNNHPWTVLPEDEYVDILPEASTATATVASGWSHISTPDSLEWDPVEPNFEESALDADTEKLLNEIERLTNQVLQETGNGNS